jgi:hypothetical protein
MDPKPDHGERSYRGSGRLSGIVVSPYSPPWYGDTVAPLCKLAGLDAKLRRSTLLDRPDR